MQKKDIDKEYVEKFLTLLSNDDVSNEEIMEEIRALVRDYEDELNEAHKEDFISNELLMSEGQKTATEIPSHINKDFLMAKARQRYFAAEDLDEEIFSELTEGEKFHHRKSIQTIFMQLVEKAKPLPEQKHEMSRTFKRIESSGDENEEKQSYYTSRIENLEEQLRITHLRIDEIVKLNKGKISTFLLERNIEELRHIKEEKTNLEKQISTYKELLLT